MPLSILGNGRRAKEDAKAGCGAANIKISSPISQKRLTKRAAAQEEENLELNMVKKAQNLGDKWTMA